MTHWFEVFRFEVRQMASRKAYLFFTFGVPLILLLAFFGYQLYQDLTASKDDESTPISEMNEDKQHIGYVDLTAAGLFPSPDEYPVGDCVPEAAANESRSALVKRITSPRCWENAVTYYADFDAGESALKDDDIDALYVIEPDYAGTGDVSIYIEGFSINAIESETLMTDYLVRSLLYDMDPADYETLYFRLLDPAVISEQQISDTGEATAADNEDENFATVYAFGLTMMMSIFWGGGYLMQSAVKEKESRIIEIVISSVRPTALFMGKILAMGALSLIQVMMFVGVLAFIGSQAGDIFSGFDGVDLAPLTIVLLLVYFALGFLLFGSLMAAIGALSTSVRESQNFVVVVTLPAAIPFFFISVFAEEPNGSLATTLSLIPFTSSLSMAMRLTVTDVSAGQIILSLGLLVLGVAGAIWFAGRLFRVNTLLSGQMPTLRDIPRLLRG